MEGEKMSINAPGSNSGTGPLVQVTGNMYLAQNKTITTTNVNHMPANHGLSCDGVAANHPKGAPEASDIAKRGERGNAGSQRDNGDNDHEAQPNNATIDMLLHLALA